MRFDRDRRDARFHTTPKSGLLCSACCKSPGASSFNARAYFQSCTILKAAPITTGWPAACIFEFSILSGCWNARDSETHPARLLLQLSCSGNKQQPAAVLTSLFRFEAHRHLAAASWRRMHMHAASQSPLYMIRESCSIVYFGHFRRASEPATSDSGDWRSSGGRRVHHPSTCTQYLEEGLDERTFEQ